MMAVIGLLNAEGFIHAWKAQRFDGFTGIASFVATLAFAPHLEWGIALGVVLSLGAYLYRTMKPPVPELSLHPDGSLRDADRHQLRRCKHIAAIRFDGPLNFANTSYLEDKVLELVAEMPDLRHVLIAAHGINEMDASGEDMLRLLVERLREAGYEVSFSGLKEEVQDALMRTGLFDRIGAQNMFPTQAHAVAAIYAKAHVNSTERDCPLQIMRPKVVSLSLHSDGSLRDSQRHGLRQCKHIAAIRFDGSLDLASSKYLEDKVNGRLLSMPELKVVLIAAHGITQIDSHGVETLSRIMERVRESNLEICFSGFSDTVMDLLKRFHLYDTIGEENIYPTQILAVRQVYARAHIGSNEESCPLEQLRPYVAELSLHPDGSLRDAGPNGLSLCTNIAALRFQGTLDRATAQFLIEKVEERVANMPHLKHVHFSCHRIGDIDDRGAKAFGSLVRWLRDSEYGVSVSGLAEDVQESLGQKGVYEIIGEENIYPTQVLAIRHIYSRAHAGSAEQNCPLTPLRPYVAELSLHSDGALRDAHRWNLTQCKHIAALRFDGSLDRSTAHYLVEKVETLIEKRPELRVIFIAGHRISRIDAMGGEILGKMVKQIRESGLDVCFSGFSDLVLDQLKEQKVYEIIDEKKIYPTQIQAVRRIYVSPHKGSDESDCPLEHVSPHVANLSLYSEGSLRDAKRFDLALCAHIAALRLDGPLDEPGSEYLGQVVEEHVKEMPHLRHVFFACHRINEIDEHGALELKRVLSYLNEKGLAFSFSGFTENLLEQLDRFHLYEAIGADNIYPTQAAALEKIHAPAHEDPKEKECPLHSVVPSSH
jgi:anti-anti-sigma factor